MSKADRERAVRLMARVGHERFVETFQVRDGDRPERAWMMLQDWVTGIRYAALGRQHAMTRQRAHQIVNDGIRRLLLLTTQED